MDNPEIILRRAGRWECEQIAKVSRASRQHFLPYLPDLHSIEEDVAYFSNVVLRQCEVWYVEQHSTLVAFCAFRDRWLDHLYCLPRYVGHGAGSKLLNKAKEGQAELSLWVFQRNERAIRFYERNGFVKVSETDGSGCEEKLPDALYRWRRDRPAKEFS